jgi:hypothetical protein
MKSNPHQRIYPPCLDSLQIPFRCSGCPTDPSPLARNTPCSHPPKTPAPSRHSSPPWSSTSPHAPAKPFVSLILGNGASGTGTPKNSRSGPQPCLTLNSSSLSSGTQAPNPRVVLQVVLPAARGEVLPDRVLVAVLHGAAGFGPRRDLLDERLQGGFGGAEEEVPGPDCVG